MKYIFWRVANVYAFLFGWPKMRSFHHGLINLSLHALGYDNPHYSGEEWFITHILAPAKIKVCVDVGANVGRYTTMLLRLLPDAKVYSIEPSKTAFQRLEHSFKNHPGVFPHQLAFSDTDGEANLYSPQPGSEKSSLSEQKDAAAESITTRRFDTFVTEHDIKEIDFVKIDTEGYEKEVLAGMTLRPKFIQFEFNINHLERDITLLSLTRLLPGYNFFRLLPHGMVPIRTNAFVDNIFMFSNIIAIRCD